MLLTACCDHENAQPVWFLEDGDVQMPAGGVE